MTAVRCTRVVTAGTFSLDGGTWEVENNVWVIGDDDQCVVIDAAHDAKPILEAVDGRQVLAVLLTHAHDDHIGAVGDLCATTNSPSYLHPDDRVLWDRVHPFPPDRELADGDTFEVGGVHLKTLHTPGHAPGACCFYSQELGTVFTGDTLFHGGPGATGRSFSDSPRSSTRSATSCSRCRRRPSCTPVTARTRPWGTSSRSSRDGSHAATDPARLPAATPRPRRCNERAPSNRLPRPCGHHTDVPRGGRGYHPPPHPVRQPLLSSLVRPGGVPGDRGVP